LRIGWNGLDACRSSLQSIVSASPCTLSIAAIVSHAKWIFDVADYGARPEVCHCKFLSGTEFGLRIWNGLLTM
jgi:hypothetical protein